MQVIVGTTITLVAIFYFVQYVKFLNSSISWLHSNQTKMTFLAVYLAIIAAGIYLITSGL